jgi:plasmid stabilization system protein ParE
LSIILSPQAASDLQRLHDFLDVHSTRSADRAAGILSDRLKLLAQFPALGKPLGRTGMRELYVPFGKSAYVIRYYLSARRNAVVVLRIWDAREQRR